MTNEQLVVRLTRELYDLKQKLEDIRGYAMTAYTEMKQTDSIPVPVGLMDVIKIIDLVDSDEIYED